MRTIKRYSNRKLYDTFTKRYVTLRELAAVLRSGQGFKVVGHDGGADITTQTLAQIMFEEAKRGVVFPQEDLLRLICGATEPAMPPQH
jgi:polyhydroxyalkanoate synthesis repressor PhaR